MPIKEQLNCAHQRAAQVCPSKSSSIVPIKEQLNCAHQRAAQVFHKRAAQLCPPKSSSGVPICSPCLACTCAVVLSELMLASRVPGLTGNELKTRFTHTGDTKPHKLRVTQIGSCCSCPNEPAERVMALESQLHALNREHSNQAFMVVKLQEELQDMRWVADTAGGKCFVLMP